VDRLRTGLKRDLDDSFLVQVALGRRAGADEVRLVRAADVQCRAVGLGVDGDRADLELAKRAEDADRDLAPVRDEDLGKEGRPHAPYSPWTWALPTS
jgi:hypothetical protein